MTPALPDSPIEVTSMDLQHNCKPCIEKVVEIAQRSRSSGKIPMNILASVHALVRYAVDTRRIRMFIIDNKLDLRTDAKSIANLRLLVGRSFKDGKLQQYHHFFACVAFLTPCREIEFWFFLCTLARYLNERSPKKYSKRQM